MMLSAWLGVRNIRENVQKRRLLGWILKGDQELAGQRRSRRAFWAEDSDEVLSLNSQNKGQGYRSNARAPPRKFSYYCPSEKITIASFAQHLERLLGHFEDGSDTCADEEQDVTLGFCP